jgi:hypothetical protein
MTAGLWLPPAVAVGSFIFLWSTTLLDRLVVSPVLALPPPAETVAWAHRQEPPAT